MPFVVLFVASASYTHVAHSKLKRTQLPGGSPVDFPQALQKAAREGVQQRQREEGDHGSLLGPFEARSLSIMRTCVGMMRPRELARTSGTRFIRRHHNGDGDGGQ